MQLILSKPDGSQITIKPNLKPGHTLAHLERYLRMRKHIPSDYLATLVVGGKLLVDDRDLMSQLSDGDTISLLLKRRELVLSEATPVQPALRELGYSEDWIERAAQLHPDDLRNALSWLVEHWNPSD